MEDPLDMPTAADWNKREPYQYKPVPDKIADLEKRVAELETSLWEVRDLCVKIFESIEEEFSEIYKGIHGGMR